MNAFAMWLTIAASSFWTHGVDYPGVMGDPPYNRRIVWTDGPLTYRVIPKPGDFPIFQTTILEKQGRQSREE